MFHVGAGRGGAETFLNYNPPTHNQGPYDTSLAVINYNPLSPLTMVLAQPSATRFAQPATQPATDGRRHEQKRRGHASAILAIRITLVLKLTVLEQLDRDAEEERRDEQRPRDHPRLGLAGAKEPQAPPP